MITQIQGQIRGGVRSEGLCLAIGKKDLEPYFCHWISKAVDWAKSDESKPVILAGWKKSGISILFDQELRSSIYHEARTLSEQKTLWNMENDKQTRLFLVLLRLWISHPNHRRL